jgi:hypothetical protein
VTRVASSVYLALVSAWHLLFLRRWKCHVIFEVFTGVTVKNVVFWHIKTQVGPHRKHYFSATESSQLMLCKIWGSHGCDYEDRRLMRCYAAWATRRNIPEDGILHGHDMFLRSVCSNQMKDTVLCYRICYLSGRWIVISKGQRQILSQITV